MKSKTYKLRYLPLFYKDLDEKLSYISDVLKNPAAARKLLDSVEAAILERLNMPESYEEYNSTKERKYPYYRIYVDNFVIYYVVINESADVSYMELRRFLYKGQNRDSIL